MKVEHFFIVKRFALKYASRYRVNLNTVESAFMMAAMEIISSVPVVREPEYTMAISEALNRRLSGLSLGRIQGEENPFGVLFKTVKKNNITVGPVDHNVGVEPTVRDELDYEKFLSLLSEEEKTYTQLILDGHLQKEIMQIMDRGQHALERIESNIKRKADRWLR